MSDVLMPLADLASYGCEADDAEIRYYAKRLEEHDAKVRADAIEECMSKVDTLEQIAFGIVDTGLVKQKLEQLKEQKNE